MKREDDDVSVLVETAVSAAEVDPGRDHTEDGVDVCADHGRAGEQFVEVIRAPERSRRQLLDLIRTKIVCVGTYRLYSEVFEEHQVLPGQGTRVACLHEAANAADDAERQDGQFGGREDPKHLIAELGRVLQKWNHRGRRHPSPSAVRLWTTRLHDKEDDEDDDPPDETEQAQEESLAGALAVHSPVDAQPFLEQGVSTALVL